MKKSGVAKKRREREIGKLVGKARGKVTKIIESKTNRHNSAILVI